MTDISKVGLRDRSEIADRTHGRLTFEEIRSPAGFYVWSERCKRHYIRHCLQCSKRIIENRAPG